MQPGKRLEGKVTIITGAASGIGAESARRFAEHGAVVSLCDVQGPAVERVAQEIAAAGGRAVARTMDVTDEAGWAAIVADAEARFGRLDALLNIAGISGLDPAQNIQTAATAGRLIENQTLEFWHRVMEINATGVFLGTRAAIPAMQRAGGGSIVNISSICGLVGSYSSGAYHASKGAVRLFSKAAAVQYGKDRIRVNSVHPGFVETAMTRTGHANPEVAAARIAATPLARFGQPYDIAMGCLYLASDEAAWITGSELVIDGGVTAV